MTKFLFTLLITIVLISSFEAGLRSESVLNNSVLENTNSSTKLVLSGEEWSEELASADIHYERIIDEGNEIKSDVETQSNPFTLPSQYTNTSRTADKLIFPAEFEESQAVLLQWPYFALDSQGNNIESFDSKFGVGVGDNDEHIVVGLAKYALDTVSVFPSILSDIADAIQKEVPVWIVIRDANDSIKIKSFMTSRGQALLSYRFFTLSQGNSFWIRDYGPISCYYGIQDSIGFLDFQYSDFRCVRPLDDLVPQELSKEIGYPLVKTSLEGFGGNFVSDGWGNIFYSSQLIPSNTDSSGGAIVQTDSTGKLYLIISKKDPLSEKQVEDSLYNLFNVKRTTSLKVLNCDGHSGNLDMYIKMIDDETFVVSEFGTEFKDSDFNDYKTVEDNIRLLRSLNSEFNKPYRVLRICVPQGDSSRNPDLSSCLLYSSYPRNFTNALIINRTIIIPSYVGGNSYNDLISNQVKQFYEQLMPGYKVIPVNCRDLIDLSSVIDVLPNYWGGAIHSVTMQIPAENPIRFKHSALRGNVSTRASFPITATITNHSGIASAVIKWRKTGETIWKEMPLIAIDNSFSANIPGNTSASNETIEYYLEAQSNNGKTRQRPIVAPDGFYSFTYGSLVSVSEENPVHAEMMNTFPNPCRNDISVSFSLENSGFAEIILFDMTGREILRRNFGLLVFGTYVRSIDTKTLSAGVYVLQMKVDNVRVGIQKVVVE